ncbi:hypothetical protein [Bradyrhizobium liaoningense]|uniref:hypothetical protein n=2 Tax=Bradyrhizobium liaoningense TaxID=43992 RepID=UPI0004AE95D8|nr:hypothetical protein [Bradyrhizobium liaoningense]
MDECRIWLDDTRYCVVDEIDFAWAKQWRWHATPNSTGRKFYATRMTRERGTRKQIKIFLHKEILKRSGKKARSVHHTIGDHDDGESLNNRRGNLFWATLKMNNSRHKQRHLIEQKEMRYEDDRP